MSHDMRTPLNGIAGMLHIADQNPKNLELQKLLEIRFISL